MQLPSSALLSLRETFPEAPILPVVFETKQ